MMVNKILYFNQKALNMFLTTIEVFVIFQKSKNQYFDHIKQNIQSYKFTFKTLLKKTYSVKMIEIRTTILPIFFFCCRSTVSP